MPSIGTSVLRRFGTRNHLTVALVGFLVAQVVFLAPALLATAREPFASGDWRTYLAAVSMLRAGQGALIYDLPTLRAVEASLGFEVPLPYPYHPAFLLVVYPFTLLSPGLSYGAWVVFSLVATAMAVSRLARLLVPPDERLLYALIVVSSVHLAFVLRVGQSTGLLLLALALALEGIIRKSDRQTGLSLAGMLIKPQLVPLLLVWLVWHRRHRALLWFAGGAALVLLVSTLTVGPTWVSSYVSLLTSGAMAFAYPWSHTIFGWSYVSIGPAWAPWLYLGAALATLALYFRSALGPAAVEPPDRRPGLAATVLASLLLTPYLFVYDLLLWAVPLALMWPYSSRAAVKVLIAVGFFAPGIAQSMALTHNAASAAWVTVGVALVGYLFTCRVALRSGQTPQRPGIVKSEAAQ